MFESSETDWLVPREPEEYKPSWCFVKLQTMGMGALSVAVLLANASQLTALIELGGNNDTSYAALHIFTMMSIIILVWTVGFIVYLGVARPEDELAFSRTSMMNNLTLLFILLAAILNVVVGAVGIGYVVKKR